MSNVQSHDQHIRPIESVQTSSIAGVIQVAHGEFDDKSCGKERYQRSLLFSGGNFSTRKRTASACALAEDELFYVLEGEFDVYVGKEAFKVEAGECVFLPNSSRTHLLSARLGFAC